MNLSSLKNQLPILALALLATQIAYADNYAHTIFVPRQLSYNPVYEDALIFNTYAHMDSDKPILLSFKPIYSQTIGSKFNKYFTINHTTSMNVQENGSGTIDSLWLKVISPPDIYYSSTLSFSPLQQTYGTLFYLACLLPNDFALTLNTAFVQRKNNMRISETNIITGELGDLPGFATVSEAFTSTQMEYGKISGSQSKGGVDDIQLKLLKNFRSDDESLFGDAYALVGIPTGKGSKAVYLFEPLVGSKHAQFGLGGNIEKTFELNDNDSISLYGEAKWRYGFKAKEVRSFDMTPNGQWSRYLLFTTPTTPTDPFFAINDLTFSADVTPRNSFDLLLAAHLEINTFTFEFGYNFWYRQSEKIALSVELPQVGIADLVGIASLASLTPVPVTSASTATISEGVYPNAYQIPRDASYTLITPENINIMSGTQAASCINALFASIGYEYDNAHVGVNTSYEQGSNSNTPSSISVWVNLDVCF